MNLSEKKWLVFYTKSRHEKKVEEYLTKREVQVFLPMQKIFRQWSDRKKKVEVPLFNSYIFVLEREDKIPFILETPGIAWNIRFNNKPAVLQAEELKTIERFITSGYHLESKQLDILEAGDSVEVIDGPLKGMLGYLTKTVEGDKFTVWLESIGQTMVARIDPTILRKRP